MRAAGTGLEFFACLAAPAALGFYLDNKFFNSSVHWLFLSGIALGFAGGLWMIYKKMSRPGSSSGLPKKLPARKRIEAARKSLDEYKKKLEER